MKTLLLYKSKWGSTKQYAEWIKEAVSSIELADLDTFDSSRLNDYDRIVIGSRVYMGRIQAQKYLVDNWNILKNKKLYVFSVGLVPADSEESKRSFELIPSYIRKYIDGYVKLPGRIIVSKISFFNKLIVKLRKDMAADKVEKRFIKPIVEYLNTTN